MAAASSLSIIAADYPKAQIKAVYTYKYLIRHTAGHDIENTDNMMLRIACGLAFLQCQH